ncbi:MAG: transposase [Candidatus Omnitrophota bacterium]
MARPLRIEYDGAVYHVTSRGNAKEPIFKNAEDRFNFFEVLAEAKKKHNIICHAYCLMDNHYHLVVETPEGNLSRAMRHINGVYTQSFNRKHKRVGHVFQGRYKAMLVDRDEYLLEVIRYVVLNPVRAGLVKSAEKWQWSSYCGTVGMSKKERFLDTDWVLEYFGGTKNIAQKKYREYVDEGIEKEIVKKKISQQSILGSESFKQKISKYVQGKKEIKEISRCQRYVGRPQLEDIFKGAQKVKAERNALIRKAITDYGYQQKEIAQWLGMHYTSVSKILSRE